MSEQNPAMKLNLAGAEFEATPENTSLFAYLGHLACYSHVFLQLGDNERGQATATYVFSSHPAFETMREYMFENGYPLHVNLQEVAECDVGAFEAMIEQQMSDIESGVPDEWAEQ